jgi:hypothetical protein
MVNKNPIQLPDLELELAVDGLRRETFQVYDARKVWPQVSRELIPAGPDPKR